MKHYNPEQAAPRFGFSAQTVRRLCFSGQLRYRRTTPTGVILIPESEIERWLEASLVPLASEKRTGEAEV